MVKKNGWKQYKRIKTPRMTGGTKERRTERAGALAERFSSKRSIENCIWQDEIRFYIRSPDISKIVGYMGKLKKQTFQISHCSTTQTGSPKM